MNIKNNLVLSIIGAAILFTYVSMSALQQQQVYAPRECEKCVEFKKMTHEYEKAVIGLIGNPDVLPPDSVVREKARVYTERVPTIFLGGPDTISGLVAQYEEDILFLFENPFSGLDKPAGVAFMQEFKKLTHDFEKAVISAVTDPED